MSQSWPDRLLTQQAGNFQLLCDNLMDVATAALTDPGCMTSQGVAVGFWHPLDWGTKARVADWTDVDGLTARLASVTIAPRGQTTDLPTGDMPITVTLLLRKYRGDAYLLTALRTDPEQFGLYYGDGETRASLVTPRNHRDSLFLDSAEQGPMFVYAYQPAVTIYRTFEVPKADLGDMALLVAPIVNDNNAKGNETATGVRPSPVVFTHLDSALTTD